MPGKKAHDAPSSEGRGTAMDLPKLLITNAVPESVTTPIAGLATLIQGGQGFEMMPYEEVSAHAPSLAGILNQGELAVDEALLDRAPDLRIIANIAIGTDNLPLDAMTPRGVWATNVPGIFAEPAAEYALAAMLVLSRRLVDAHTFVKEGRWSRLEAGRWDGQSLEGRTLGLVGYGAIGQRLAEMVRPFEMQLLIHARRPRPEDPRFVPLDDLLARSDYVCLAVPKTADTHHLIDASALAKMPTHAFLINVARGGVVDDPALIEALKSGALAGAALDVFENEPRLHEAFRHLPNVFLTPHLGGSTRGSRHRSRMRAFENVAAALRGERPPDALNEFDAALSNRR